MYDWLDYYGPGPGILLEKSPPTAIRGRWLQATFPPSRFIAVTRHPDAVCEGIRRRTGLPIDQAAQHWLLGNELLLDDVDLYPDEMLSDVARRLGFGPLFDEAVGLASA